jgi:hypothetical protein
MELASRLALASDAAQYSVLGAALWVIAGLAAAMEWRRSRSRSVERLEQVGWMPWTGIFLTCAMIGGGFLAMSLPVLVGSL